MTTSSAFTVLDPSIRWPELGMVSMPVFARGGQYRADDGWARLSLSESSLGCSPAARQAVVRELGRLHRYPDPGATSLAAAVAEREDVSADHVVAGNGIDELLLMSALALVDSAAGAVVSANTYPGHANAVRATRQTPMTVRLRAWRVDVDRVIDSMLPGGVVIVCNPHNPTGAALTREEVDALALAASERRSVLIVDEAYIEYATPDETASAVKHVRAGLPVIVLRTFSKIHGLAGLRCGYALAPSRLCDELRRLKNVLVFNVNRLALVAAEASLHDGAFVDDVRVRTRDALADLHTWLRAQPWAARRRQ